MDHLHVSLYVLDVAFQVELIYVRFLSVSCSFPSLLKICPNDCGHSLNWFWLSMSVRWPCCLRVNCKFDCCRSSDLNISPSEYLNIENFNFRPNRLTSLLCSNSRDQRLDGSLGQTHEESMLQDSEIISKDQPHTGHVPDWPQRPCLAQSTNTYDSSRSQRVWFHAAHLYHPEWLEAVASHVAALQSA